MSKFNTKEILENLNSDYYKLNEQEVRDFILYHFLRLDKDFYINCISNNSDKKLYGFEHNNIIYVGTGINRIHSSHPFSYLKIIDGFYVGIRRYSNWMDIEIFNAEYITKEVPRDKISDDIYLFKDPIRERYHIEDENGVTMGNIVKKSFAINQKYIHGNQYSFVYQLKDVYTDTEVIVKSIKHLTNILPYEQFITRCSEDDVECVDVALKCGFKETEPHRNGSRYFVFNK